MSNRKSASLTALLRPAMAACLSLAMSGCAFHVVHFHHHHNHQVHQQLQGSNLTQIGVNAYLWRASLDALSFMPLAQTDSKGGVIVTDWYTDPASPGEHMKITVTVVDSALSAASLHVVAKRQLAGPNGWVDAPVQAATAQKLEEIILTKARNLRTADSIGN